LTQLRTIFDLIITFQGIQDSMYRAAKDELEARQNYDNSKITSEERVNISSFILYIYTCTCGDDVLVWLSVCSEVQMFCIWFS